MEKLKELLGEELYKQLEEKLGDKKVFIDDGNYIPKQRFDEVNNEKKELQNQLKERDGQLEELRKNSQDSKELQDKIQELQQANEETKSQYEQKIKEQKFNFALEQDLMKSQAKNVKAAKALVDTEKVSLDDDGNLIGLDEQLKQIKEENDYLFGPDLRGNRTDDTQSTPPAVKNNPWKKESLNLTEQGRILKEDPKLAERLKSEAGVK